MTPTVEHRPYSAHSVSLSLSPYPRSGSPYLYTDALYAHMRARVCACGTSLGAAARHAPGDVGVRERLPPALLQSIPTDAFVLVAFVPGRSHAVHPRRRFPSVFYEISLVIIGLRVNFTLKLLYKFNIKQLNAELEVKAILNINFKLGSKALRALIY